MFCLGYAAFEFNAALGGGGSAGFVLGGVFSLLSVGLGMYLRHLGRFLGYEGKGPAGR